MIDIWLVYYNRKLQAISLVALVWIYNFWKHYFMNWITKLFPFLLWIKDLKNPKVLKADTLAGITVALVIIPQSMAYAQLAGLVLSMGSMPHFYPS